MTGTCVITSQPVPWNAFKKTRFVSLSLRCNHIWNKRNDRKKKKKKERKKQTSKNERALLILLKCIFKNRFYRSRTARRATSNILRPEARNILRTIEFSARSIVTFTREKKFITWTWTRDVDFVCVPRTSQNDATELKGERRIHDNNTLVFPLEEGREEKKSIFPCLLSSRWINARFVIASTDVRVDDTR